ncbi:MAG: ribonuclease HII [Methylobacter sp.]|nr:ribonuclease HII [Methylobacter sp.]
MQNFNITGVDEAGRGPLAGPVVAAAVILNPMRPIKGLADSKILSESKRDKLSIIIKEAALSWSVAHATVEEIDELNILQATLLAMRRAVEGLHIRPDEALIDGNCLPDLSIPARAIARGDSKVKAISAASILAKVERDKIMCNYYKKYPDFSFHQHKGYGTKQHLTEIEQFGFLDIHRKTFNPVKSIIIQMKAK